MSKSTSPLVSVCIPAYNSEEFIGETIESVLAQSMDDFELVIVDDCSTDGTADVIGSFDDPRIRFMQNEKNLGFGGNWNKVLGEAGGLYYKLLPGDDLLRADCLERQVAVLEGDKGKEIALVCCARDIIDANGKRMMTRSGYGDKELLDGPSAVRKTIRSGSNLMGEPGAGLFRRELIEKTGGYDGSNPFLIDMDMWVKVLMHGKLYFMAEPLSSFRVSKTSYSVGMAGDQSRKFSEFIDKVDALDAFSLTSFDVSWGKLQAKKNAILRMLFYALSPKM